MIESAILDDEVTGMSLKPYGFKWYLSTESKLSMRITQQVEGCKNGELRRSCKDGTGQLARFTPVSPTANPNPNLSARNESIDITTLRYSDP